MQTILGTYLPSPRLTPSREHRLTLPDGDRLVFHDSLPPRWRAGLPIAVLVHGLGGSHQSGYLRRLACLLLQREWRVVRLDLRGCGKGIPLARKPYHAGCSDDVRAVLAHLHAEAASSPLVLIGFSLGGNISLKLAGEARNQPAAGLTQVVAVNPPIDLLRASDELARPGNRLYQQHFVRALIDLVRQRTRYFPDHQTHFPRGLSLRRFDDLYTAPRNGFNDALDYYARASALPWIPRISLPTLILASSNDPLVPVEPFLSLTAPPAVEVQIASGGGHLGFLGWDGAGGIRWADRRVLDWLDAQSIPAGQSS